MVFHYLRTGFNKIKAALKKARSFFGEKISSLFQGKMDEEKLEKLEQLFYEADFGVQTSLELTEKVRQFHKKNPAASHEDYIAFLKNDLVTQLKSHSPPLEMAEKLTVCLIVGVNGNGKTTTIAKLAKYYQDAGKKVLLGAGDTFRAAAIDQLEIWAKRLGTDLVKGQPKSDPAAVAFDTIKAGLSRNIDLVLIDTAGRLHTKSHLMQELEKIGKTCKKLIPDAPQETFLVLDATTGQNAIDQAKQFHKHTPLTGLILTKLDGTAKGGIVVAIQREVSIPIRFVGVGEEVDDLELFDAEAFVEGLFD